jgi:pimeloyl-ACP methyl ester carboxylesterase
LYDRSFNVSVRTIVHVLQLEVVVNRILAVARAGLVGLSVAAPPLAVEAAYRMFRHVGAPAPVRAADRAVHERARRGRVHVHGYDVATYSWGDPAAPPVLLAHGWQLRAARFAVLVEALEAADLRPVAFDGPAHGASTGRRTTVLEHVAAMRAVQETTGPLAAVVGHSLGGLAAGLAVRDGLAADRYVAIAAPTGFDSVVGTFRRRAGLPDRLHEPLCERVARGLFPGVDEARARLDLTRRPVPAGVPALFVHDVDDPLHGSGEARRLHAAHPGSELLVTAGLGHNRLLDDPDVVAAVVQHVKEPAFVR